MRGLARASALFDVPVGARFIHSVHLVLLVRVLLVAAVSLASVLSGCSMFQTGPTPSTSPTLPASTQVVGVCLQLDAGVSEPTGDADRTLSGVLRNCGSEAVDIGLPCGLTQPRLMATMGNLTLFFEDNAWRATPRSAPSAGPSCSKTESDSRLIVPGGELVEQAPWNGTYRQRDCTQRANETIHVCDETQQLAPQGAWLLEVRVSIEGPSGDMRAWSASRSFQHAGNGQPTGS